MADIYAEVTAVGIQGLSGTGTGNGATGATGPAGATGPQGIQGASGVQGASGIQGIDGASGYVGSDGATGQTGATGPKGADGTSIKILGSLPSSSSLDPAYTGDIGDSYITDDSGDLWVWSGITWTNVGSITGSTGAQGIQGASGVQGASGATGIRGASGVQGASGSIGLTGATGSQGIQGASGSNGVSGATGPQGIQGASGITGASGISGASGYIGHDGATGATGLTGATGFGLGQTVFTTSSTNRVVVETLDATLYRSAKYEMQVSTSSKYQALEFRLLIDNPNVFLVQYGSIGTSLGTFESFYSPLNNSFISPAINTGGLSYWNGTSVRVYTTDNAAIQALLSIPSGTVVTLNSGATSFTTSGSFTEVSNGVYGVTSVETRSPTLLISRIQWTGSGQIELRFTPDYAVTTLKYLRTTIDI